MTGCDQSDRTTVASLGANLAELIHAMLQDGRALIALCEFSDHRYVQFWLQSDGRLIGEVISNLNIDESRALAPRAEERLRELGFHEPALGPKPNWWFASTDAAGTVRLLHMMNGAIDEVLEEQPGNPVFIKTWMAETQPGESLEETDANRRVYQRWAVEESAREEPESD